MSDPIHVAAEEMVPSPLVALRILLDDPTYGPVPIQEALSRSGGKMTSEILSLLGQDDRLTVWSHRFAMSQRGDQLLLEAGIEGHLFPADEAVVLMLGEDQKLSLQCLQIGEGFEHFQQGELHGVITRYRGPYWDRALYHLGTLE
jgi:hypothetical protein